MHIPHQLSPFLHRSASPLVAVFGIDSCYARFSPGRATGARLSRRVGNGWIRPPLPFLKLTLQLLPVSLALERINGPSANSSRTATLLHRQISRRNVVRGQWGRFH